MFLVNILVSIPFSREEGMLFSDYFSVKERHHLRVLVRQVLDFQISANIGVLLIHVLKYLLSAKQLTSKMRVVTCSMTSTSY